VPAGSVVFKIVNRAKIARDFEIAGKKTPIIGTRKSATLRTVVAMRPYRYFSVSPGHARLSGLLGVLKACANPTTSTVEVQISSGIINLSPTTARCGTVTFIVTNKEEPASQVVHDFEVSVPTSVKPAVSPLLRPGETANITVNVPYKDKVYYKCGVGRDAELGEEGFLVVD
jgi:hypothetical protein